MTSIKSTCGTQIDWHWCFRICIVYTTEHHARQTPDSPRLRNELLIKDALIKLKWNWEKKKGKIKMGIKSACVWLTMSDWAAAIEQTTDVYHHLIRKRRSYNNDDEKSRRNNNSGGIIMIMVHRSWTVWRWFL